MHEISLVQGLFHQLSELLLQHGASRVLQIVVEIGDRAGIVKESFEFAFDILSKEYEYIDGAELVIVDGSNSDDLVLLRVEME